MAPFAAPLFIVGICGLLWLDRSGARISRAAWVPFLWLTIASSRPVSSWGSAPVSRSETYFEGSPLDRNILTLLILLGLLVLSRRTKQAKAILGANVPILMFLAYCLISVLWADYPVVAFKRWVRGAADIVMVLIVLTELDRERALQAVVSRMAYVLVPVSLLFIRFYPHLGRDYSMGGDPMWTGVGTDKNALGALCMVCGLVVLWRLMEVFSSHGRPHRTREFVAMSAVFAIILYLILIVDSKTALLCFAMGSIPVVFQRPFRSPAVVSAYVASAVLACYIVVSFDIGGAALEVLGRNESLTGRTNVWRAVLSFATSPLFGAGYENFWIGERQQALNRLGGNQAHNGYIEIYLNLGWIGLTLLAAVILAGYRNLLADVRSKSQLTGLKVAFFVICLAYNFTEASFKMMSPVWLMFLLATMAAPRLVTSEVSPRLVTSERRFRAAAAVKRSRRLVEIPNTGVRQGA